MCSAVASPVVVGLVARTTSRDAAALDPAQQLGDLQVLGVDPVDRREGAAEHVVEAAVFVGALDRDHVGRLLDHADRRPVAVRVGADPAERALGEVEALLAEADLLLHFADRRRRAPKASSSGARRRWKASRCAVRWPIPGSRESSATRRASGAGPSVLTSRAGRRGRRGRR